MRFITGSLILMVGISTVFSGCLAGDQRPIDETTFSGKGTVVLVAEEGGFFGIVADDGKKYYPLDLEDQYKVHGLQVTFFVKLRGDKITLQQWGTPVEIIEITFIPAEQHPDTENENETVAITVLGTVEYVNENGGFYGVIGDDGTRYVPLNMMDEFKRDGITVIFEAVMEDGSPDRAWGTPIRILDIAEV
jgi:hypothetical protein